jgi:outer membrane protein assembly factor BamB
MSLARPAACLLFALAGACASGPEDSASPQHESSREGMTATIDRWKAEGRLGEELWRINLSERFGAPVHAKRVTIDGDLALVEDSDHRIHALDRVAGAHRWFIDLPAATTQVVGGTESSVTFVCTDDACAVTRSHGSRMMGNEDAPRTTEHLDFFPSGRAVAIGSSLYVGRLAPFSLQAIDLLAGHAGWSYATASPVMDSVAYGDGPIGQILSITEDGLLFSMPPRDASESAWAPKENWHRRIPGTRPATPLTLVGDHLVFGTENGFLYDVDARNGVVRWKVGCGSDLHGHEATIAGDAVYQHTDGGVRAFDSASGNELWDLYGASRVITRIGDRVYADVGDGQVVVVAAASGKEIARFATGGLSVPTVQGGGSLIACDGTNLFALK